MKRLLFGDFFTGKRFYFGSDERTYFWHSYSTTSGEYKLLTKEIIPEFEKHIQK